MKIYFAGSIRGGRVDKEMYLKIIEHLKRYGQVLTEHVGDQNLTIFGELKGTDHEIFRRDLSWLKESDVVVAEVSTPSLGVGYEIAKAEELGKRILCLCRKMEDGKRLSPMISGNETLIVIEYEDIEEALSQIDRLLK